MNVPKIIKLAEGIIAEARNGQEERPRTYGYEKRVGDIVLREMRKRPDRIYSTVEIRTYCVMAGVPATAAGPVLDYLKKIKQVEFIPGKRGKYRLLAA